MTTSPKWRVALASAASAAVLVATPLTGAPAAHAQPPYPPTGPTLSLSSYTVRSGQTVSFTARGFTRRQLVTVELLSRTIVLGRYRADRFGAVQGRVRVPRIASGMHVFRLTALRPYRHVAVNLRVMPPLGRPGGGRHGWHDDGRGGPGNRMGLAGSAQSLAKTGDEKALGLGGAAAGMIAAGGGTLLVMRRRRNS
ncbi:MULTISPECIES: LPXTG cell wall anchor domain-containing protein [unclassified Streptomyces]|uniref:LPXTG cell wall anchor domain-containing protein n=1 Tax=unclassified Streptomyces TaxID=2593676 RepID=UPI0036283972